MFYTKKMFEGTNPKYCSNCGEGENYKRQEVLDHVIETIHCYSCDNKAELVGKNEVS